MKHAEHSPTDNKYYIHSPKDSWAPGDLRDIKIRFEELGYTESVNAAIGEGAGGPGWETMIEFVLTTSAIASLTEQIWRVIKFLKSKKPKEKAPNGKEIYRAVFHTHRGRVTIDLTTPIEDIDIAVNKNLVMRMEENELRVYELDKQDWTGY